MYCPYKDCSSLIINEVVDLDEGSASEPALCPECEREFCPKCLITGWHQVGSLEMDYYRCKPFVHFDQYPLLSLPSQGFTCSQFSELPDHHRSADDAAMLRLSMDKHWKKCPSCGMLVERSEGCNHVRCRCQTSFCYACGLQYKSKDPTAGNMHGTPSCTCGLFEFPDDDDSDDDGDEWAPRRLPFPPPALPPPERQRRFLGRMNDRPCRNSRYLRDCPFGRRCWFRHEDD